MNLEPKDSKLKNFILKTFSINAKNLSLYKQALTHRSYLNETGEKNLKSYERLEFLGDTVISFIISQKIYNQFPEFPEGELTNFRSALVKTESLAEIAQKIGLGNYLFLSKGEEESRGRQNQSILADSLEAITAAIFLDQGVEKAQKILDNLLSSLVSQIRERKTLKDYKSLLQEICQERLQLSPSYKVIKTEGPDHKKIFTIATVIGKKIYETGTGYSKQEAEQQAAQKTLEKWHK